MPRDTRSKHEHWLIGSSTDVLKNTFVESYCRGDQIDMSTARPFSGPLNQGALDAPYKRRMFEIVVVLQGLRRPYERTVSVKRNNHWDGGKGDLSVLDYGRI